MKLFDHLELNEEFAFLSDEAALQELIADPDSGRAKQVMELADKVRALKVGDAVHLRGLIEFSNHCRNNCCYCGLRRDHCSLERYRLSIAEIVAAARTGVELGYQTVVLQSGEDPYYTGPMLAEIITEIKKLGLVVTLSAGERDPEEYALWRRAGAERYLMRHETANPELYRKLHPGQSLQRRIRLLRILKDLDYQVGTGFMVGLPGQTAADLVSDLKLVKALDVEMIGIGPFIPHPATPLAECAGGTLHRTVLMVALARLVQPKALIPATTALGSIDPLGREAALQAGANVMMPNLTPTRFRPSYEIYPNKICLGEAASECRGCITGRIERLGRKVGNDPGHNLNCLRRQNHDRLDQSI